MYKHILTQVPVSLLYCLGYTSGTGHPWSWDESLSCWEQISRLLLSVQTLPPAWDSIMNRMPTFGSLSNHHIVLWDWNANVSNSYPKMHHHLRIKDADKPTCDESLGVTIFISLVLIASGLYSYSYSAIFYSRACWCCIIRYLDIWCNSVVRWS